MEGQKVGTRIGPDVVSESFGDFLKKAKRGTVDAKLAAKLKDVLLGVRETRKAGRVTLTIDIEPVKDTARAVKVDFKVNGKVPEVTEEAAVYFLTDEGALTRDNPRQRDLFEGNEGEEKGGAS